uniref:Wzt carbohydrate-binding domain-containing protein n=1 Tax=Paraconexibacter sp. TaxID=2949640 RepID=UPI0035631624
ASGKTIVFVTHDMNATERFCDRAMLIERGDVIDINEPHVIARAYNELNFGRLVHDEVETGRYGDRTMCEIADAWFESPTGERIAQVAHGEPVRAAVRARFFQPVENPVFGVTLRNELGHTIFATTTEQSDLDVGSFSPGDEVTLRIGFQNVLVASNYKLTPSIARAGSGSDTLDLREDLTSLLVHSTHSSGGIVDLPYTFEMERA